MLLIDAQRQHQFALLSGDYNPLHVDPLQARRSQFGGCVVHGVHLVLAALNSLDLERPHRIVRLDAQFRSAVLVGEAIWTRVTDLGDGEYRFDVGVEEQTRMTVAVSLAPLDATANAPGTDPAPVWPTAVASPRDLDDLASAVGREVLALDDGLAAALFPSLGGSVIGAHIAALLAVTRVVGMHCPGQWALFRRLTWQPGAVDASPEALDWSVAEVNARYAMVKVAFLTAGVSAQAEVIVREPPPRQATLEIVRTLVNESEFAGARALVVGASRGLGELAAKVMAAGGAKVLLTFGTGEDDARRVADDIGDMADIAQLTAEQPSPASADRIERFAPTHVLYFATPTIAKRPSGTFDPIVYERLQSVYATGCAKVLNLAQTGGALRAVFFPSSIYVEQHPAGFAEYVAAKQAGEVICTTWQQLHRDQIVVIERLPPLVTDQTAAKLRADTGTNVEVLLSALRLLHGASRAAETAGDTEVAL